MHRCCRPTPETDEVPFVIFQAHFAPQEFGIFAFNPSAVLSHSTGFTWKYHIYMYLYLFTAYTYTYIYFPMEVSIITSDFLKEVGSAKIMKLNLGDLGQILLHALVFISVD